ncbi:hypothetical protein HA402_000553 [Bradysia odoriphaga]|nr:hypothetical protein HA402_000553 [Bradysia odoriphaga]
MKRKAPAGPIAVKSTKANEDVIEDTLPEENIPIDDEYDPEGVPSEDDSSSNGPAKKKKRYSPVWNHFSIEIKDEKTEFANCNYCPKKYPLSGKSNGSTSNLIRHLKSVHPEITISTISEDIEIIEFSQERYRDALVKWIVTCNQPFSEVEQETFLEMIKILNPAAITISSPTVKRDIIKKFEEKVKVMIAHLKKVPGKISFTIDAWTSQNVLPFVAIRAHWINSEWVYETVLLDFLYIDGSHDGQKFSDIFLKCLDRFEIPFSKVLALTMDNASPNDTFMEFLRRHGIEIGVDLSASANRVRCMLHILNLVVQDILAFLKIPLNYEEDVFIEEKKKDACITEEEEVESDDEEDVSSMPTVPKLRKLVKKIQCDANEVRTNGNDRCYNHCNELSDPSKCRKFANPTPGCYCKVGFCRTPGANNSGKCIPIPQCDANEALTMGDDRCYNHCNELDKPGVCRKFNQPTLGCYCKEGFCRTGGDDNSGECIPIVDPATCTPDKNEIFSTGDDRCYNHCNELDKPGVCRKYNRPTPGCYCAEGFCRTGGDDNSGECIPIVDPATCTPDKNEIFSTGDDRCYNHCNELDKPGVCRKYNRPTPGCYCAEGFCRTGGDDNSGECIPIVDPATCTPDKNEIFSTGDDRCYNHCNELDKPGVCRKYNRPTPGCYCAEGFCRTGGDDNSGECIPIVDPATCTPDKNEIFSTGDDRCYNHCNELDKPGVCRKYNKPTPGCYCAEGYCRTGGDDNSGVCIRIEDVTTPEPNEPITTPEPTEPITTPEPNEPITTPEPNEPITTPEPNEPITTPEPNEPITTPEPNEPITTPEPNEPITTPEPNEPITTPEPSEPITTPEPNEPITTPEPNEPITTPEPNEPITTPEPNEPITTPEPNEPITTPEPNEPITTPEPNEPITTPEPNEPITTPEPNEPITTPEPSNPTCSAPYEIYRVGISPCGNTCSNYKKPCNIATLIAIEGCDCIDGYARIFLNGPCVSVTDKRCEVQWSTKPTNPPCSGGLLGGLDLGAIVGTVVALVSQVLGTIVELINSLTLSLTSIGECENTEIIGDLASQLTAILNIIASLNGSVTLQQLQIIFDVLYRVVGSLTTAFGVDAVSVLTKALEEVASSLVKVIKCVAGKTVKQVKAALDAAVRSVAKAVSIFAHLVSTVTSVAVRAVHKLVEEAICTLVIALDIVLLFADTVIAFSVAAVGTSSQDIGTVIVTIETTITEVTNIVSTIAAVLSSTTKIAGNLSVVVNEAVQSLVSVTKTLTGNLQIVTNLVGNLSGLVCNISRINASINATVGGLVNTVTGSVTGILGRLGGLFGRSCN